MDKLTELAKEREDLLLKLDRVETEMRAELGGGGILARRGRPGKVPGQRGRPPLIRKPEEVSTTNVSTEGLPPTDAEGIPSADLPTSSIDTGAGVTEELPDGTRVDEEFEDDEDEFDENTEGYSRKTTMKDLIANHILPSSNHPMELREVVAVVREMINANTYKTKAKDESISPIVSQALHALKDERVVLVEKSKESPYNRLYSLRS